MMMLAHVTVAAQELQHAQRQEEGSRMVVVAAAATLAFLQAPCTRQSILQALQPTRTLLVPTTLIHTKGDNTAIPPSASIERHLQGLQVQQRTQYTPFADAEKMSVVIVLLQLAKKQSLPHFCNLCIPLKPLEDVLTLMPRARAKYQIRHESCHLSLSEKNLHEE
jgi:hypothetical protein